MKINDLIFKELIKRGYKLEGKTRVWDVADSKLWYLQPEQAQGFLDLENAPEYKKSVTDKEVGLILENLPQIIKSLPYNEYNIVDLGCGDGNKAILFIKNIPSNFKLRYCPVDISGYMVQKAINNIKSLKNIPVVEFNWNISDFDNLPNLTSVLSNDYYKNNFLLLLGDTFGNFDSDDILSSIKSSMKKGDVLLLGNNLILDDLNDNLKPYKNSHLDHFLLKLIEQLGLCKDEVRYDARFNEGRIEMYYDITKNKIIKHNNRIVSFLAGDRIVVAYSYRYSFDEIKRRIESHFKDTQYFIDRENDYCLAVSRH